MRPIDQLRATLQAMNGKTVLVGWFAENRYPDGTPVAIVASHLEFGTRYRPATPFIRQGMVVYGDNIRKTMRSATKKTIDGIITPEQGLMQIGEAMATAIRKSIKDGGWPQESEETIKRKGLSAPLRDTTHLWKTITVKVQQ